jgi:hypothetical protein
VGSDVLFPKTKFNQSGFTYLNGVFTVPTPGFYKVDYSLISTTQQNMTVGLTIDDVIDPDTSVSTFSAILTANSIVDVDETIELTNLGTGAIILQQQAYNDNFLIQSVTGSMTSPFNNMTISVTLSNVLNHSSLFIVAVSSQIMLGNNPQPFTVTDQYSNIYTQQTDVSLEYESGVTMSQQVFTFAGSVTGGSLTIKVTSTGSVSQVLVQAFQVLGVVFYTAITGFASVGTLTLHGSTTETLSIFTSTSFGFSTDGIPILQNGARTFFSASYYTTHDQDVSFFGPPVIGSLLSFNPATPFTLGTNTSLISIQQLA